MTTAGEPSPHWSLGGELVSLFTEAFPDLPHPGTLFNTPWGLKCFPRQTARCLHMATLPVPSAPLLPACTARVSPGERAVLRNPACGRQQDSRRASSSLQTTSQRSVKSAPHSELDSGDTFSAPCYDHTVPLQSQLTWTMPVGLRMLSQPCLMGQALSGCGELLRWLL